MEKSITDALLAIASVGAVVWTGGLIVRQLFPTNVSIDLQNGMIYAMFASFGAIAGLLLTGLTLQIATAAFFVLYGGQYFLSLRSVYRQYAGLEPIPKEVTDSNKYLNDGYRATLYQGFLLIPYPIIIYWHNQFCIACVGAASLFVGYQALLCHLQAARPDQFSLTAQVAQSVGIVRLVQVLEETLNFLKQKL